MCPRPLAFLIACLTLGVVTVGAPASAQTKTYRVYDTFTDPQEPRNLQNHPPDWSNAWINQPQFVDDDYPVPSCAGGTVIADPYRRYAISGRWTYHGRSSDGCRLRDNICRALRDNAAGFLGCFFAAVLPGSAYCSGARDENWSYTDVLYGHSQEPVRTIIATQPCYTEL